MQLGGSARPGKPERADGWFQTDRAILVDGDSPGVGASGREWNCERIGRIFLPFAFIFRSGRKRPRGLSAGREVGVFVEVHLPVLAAKVPILSQFDRGHRASDVSIALTPSNPFFMLPAFCSISTDAVRISPDQTAVRATAGGRGAAAGFGWPLKQNLLPDKVRIFSASLYLCIKAGLSPLIPFCPR